MLIVPEQLASQLVSVEDAIEVVGEAFAASYAGNAQSYPVVREQTGHADAVFGVKAGFDASLPVLGLKAGGYWPGNVKRGLGNHQSSVLLFDADTGRAIALVGANYLTGIRTGAAGALATRGLASADASILGIVGAAFSRSTNITRRALCVRSHTCWRGTRTRTTCAGCATWSKRTACDSMHCRSSTSRARPTC